MEYFMSLQELKSQLGEHAKDIKLNLGSVLTEEGAPDLTQNQIYGIALASAYATKSAAVAHAVQHEISGTLPEAEVHAAKAAATIMAMNNIYYRFTHLASAPDYKTLPARLRMNVIGKPGVDKVDFELWCLAVSAINGCGVCIDSHEKILREGGLSAEQIQAAVRVAAVVHAVAATLDGEAHSADLAINAVAA
jgi:alkyl hydroperoxide reductase subunit D